MIDSAQIALLFEELANLMELAGVNYFKIRAYRQAANTIRGLARPLKGIPPVEIAKLPGIGKAITDKIASALESGTFPTLEKWRQSEYATLLPLVKIDGLDIRKLRGIIKTLNISSIDGLKISIDDGAFDSYKNLEFDLMQKIKENVLANYAGN